MASDDRKNIGQRKGFALENPSPEQQPAPLTVTPELSQLLHRTTELAAAAAAAASRPAGDAAVAKGGEEKEEHAAATAFAKSSGRSRPGSGSGNAGSLRLRRLPSSRCPSCSGAPFTDASFLDYGNGNDADDDEAKSSCKNNSPLESSRLWLLENGRSLSAPLLALLVAAASVTWSLYEYAGSSAAALGGPALYLAKACVATSQASYGMVFLPVSRGLVTALRATSLRRYFDFDNAIKYHIWLAVIGAAAGTLHGVFVTAAALTWTQRPADEQLRLGSPAPLSLRDIAATRAFVTGWVLVLLIVVAYPFATGWPKRSARLRGTRLGAALNSFTNFWLTHHLLIIVFPVVLIAHCVGIPTSELLAEERPAQLLLSKANKMLLLLLPPMAIYALERLVRMWRSTRPTPVLSARLFPTSSGSGSASGSASNGGSENDGNTNNSNSSNSGGILELRVKKPRGFRFTSGQYIHLCCPAISSFEWHPFTLASAPQDPFLMIVIKDVGDWTHALHELVREKGEARDGRLLLSSSAAATTTATTTTTTKPAAASPTFSVVAAASSPGEGAPERSAFGGSRDLESQLSAAAAAASAAAAAGGLPPLPPSLARGSSLSAPLPILAAAIEDHNNNNHPAPLTKRVSFAEEKVASLVAEATKGEGEKPTAPSLAPPPPSAATAAPPRTARSRRRTRDSDIPYTFSIDGPWGAPTQEFADYDVVVLLGAGIGVTPMASVLRSLAHELAHARCPSCARVNEALVSERIRQSRVYFHWILPDSEGVQWFSDVLFGISAADTLGMFDLNLHFTRVDGGGGEKSRGGGRREAGGDGAAAAAAAANKSGVAIHSGRPDFDRILGQVKAAHPEEHIGVFFCGPGGLSADLRETCRSLNRRTTTTATAGGGEDGSGGGASSNRAAAASESGCSARSSSRRSGFGGGEISYFEEVFCKNEAATTTTKVAARKSK